ncbi:hypothetical protein [Streptomyces sp. NPDC088910]|uniref:hypothetical protein n=1 Tax=Streptomyces sp. NPDC088910 TaxID=3365911 RepID=UPI0037FC666B
MPKSAFSPPATAPRPVPPEPPDRTVPLRHRLPGRLPLPRLGPTDRAVLWLYALTRVGVWTTAYCTGRLFTGDGKAQRAPSMMSRWEQWDWGYYLHIARDGYFPAPVPGAVLGSGAATPDNREAFFPGFPLLLRAVHLLIRDWTAAGLLISFVAGAVAVLSLARIAALDGRSARTSVAGRGADRLPDDGNGTGSRAVLFLLLSPCAVFLAAGYTEALFLAFALPCWLAAKRGNWPLAAALAAAATTVRISGLFLGAALVVQLLTSGPLTKRLRLLHWPALSALPALVYAWYLHARTGDWMAWKHAEERGWYRTFHSPWQAWRHTWDGAFDHTQATPYALLFQFELVAMAVGLALLCLLLKRRRWPEAVYLGLSLWALGTSYWYMSVPRASLLWWPLWTGLAAWSVRRPWLTTAYVCVAAPLATVLTVAFTSGRWAG